MLGDFDFPTQEDYLTRKNACAEAKKTFKQLWNRYKKSRPALTAKITHKI